MKFKKKQKIMNNNNKYVDWGKRYVIDTKVNRFDH